MCTNTDHSPPEQALKSTGLSRLTDNWMRGCAGGETRLWKANSRPSPMKFHDGEMLTVQSILFSLVLTQVGKDQFNFTAIPLA